VLNLYSRFDSRIERTDCSFNFNTVVKPRCTTGFTTGCIHDTAGCQSGFRTGLFDNRIDNRLYRVNGALENISRTPLLSCVSRIVVYPDGGWGTRVHAPSQMKHFFRTNVIHSAKILKDAFSKGNQQSTMCGQKLRFVFQHLPEPNMACLVGVYAVTLDPLLSLYGIIYVTWYTRLLPKAIKVRFR